MNLDELKAVSQAVRETAIELSYLAKSAHLGSSLSCVELVTYLLAKKKVGQLDRFILSKGHAAMALYSAANCLGLVGDEHLKHYLSNDTQLWGHPSYKKEFSSFIDWSTGSLGHGLSVTAGFALARKLDNSHARVACLISDGELDEGSNWESILFAGHHHLTNLLLFVDYNKIQSLGRVNDVIALEPLADKFRAFCWDAIEIDGHDLKQIEDSFKRASERPLAVICHTVKGKGLPQYEDTVASHYKPATEVDARTRRFV